MGMVVDKRSHEMWNTLSFAVCEWIEVFDEIEIEDKNLHVLK